MKSTHTEVELDLLVLERREAADGVVSLALAGPGGTELPDWTPGAHIDLQLGEGLVRQYSLCGDPADRRRWRIGVLREPESRGGSRFVHERLVEGATVRVRGPRNHFELLSSPRYVFVAGGIGITPIAAMVGAAEQAGADWRLVYGGRSRDSMAFREELAARYGDRVRLAPQDEVGLIDLDALLGTPTPDTLVYCCGPEPLLKAVEERCGAWPAGTLHIERFTPKRLDTSAPDGAFEVELTQSGITLTVEPGRSILETVEQAGIEVLSSCREGTCGTCETAVVSGEPEHRDSLLTPEEQAANDTMFICVSRSRSPKLVLEL